MLGATILGLGTWTGTPASAGATPRAEDPPACAGDAVTLPSGADLCDGGDGAETSAGPASILLTKTVGTDANSCATTSAITVSTATEQVIYCYSVENNGTVALTSHDLDDDKLGQLLDGLSYDLQPGAKTFATAAATLSGSPQVITNIATWTATNGTDTADSTAQATVTVEDGASAPTPVTATPAEGEATVSWTTPSSNGGHPILGYRIAIAQSGQPFGTIDVGNVLTTKITDLPNGSSYQFSVRAVTETGPGAAGVSPSVDVDWWLPWSTPSKAGTEIYTWLTGKAPTSGQLATFLSAGDGGALPGEQIELLRRSTDATLNVDPVIRLYTAYFLRPPDKSGFAFWLNRRRSGSWTIARISAFFADSSEFKNRYGSLSNGDFVKLVYQNVLGRQPDAGGLAYWTGQLDQRKKSRGQVMANFSESSEYVRKRASYVDASSLLIQLLGTSPSRAGAEALAAEIDGSSFAATARRLIHEPSFDSRAG
ncbi:MAG: DUF4214 domain-containing protein [Acidimicrobiales bacterium]